jgi:Secretion system C-terminal sorting domain
MKKLKSLIIFVLVANTVHAQNELYIQGSVFYIGNGAVVQVNGSLTNTINSDLINNGTLTITGNITNNQLMPAANAGKLIFNGTSPQTTNGSIGYVANDVEINNAAGITLNNQLIVVGNCAFINGLVAAPSATAPLWFRATGTSTGAADASHVNGYVVKLGTGSFTYPVGDAVKYQKTEVTLGTNGSGMQVKYNAANVGNGPFTLGGTEPIALVSYNTNEYWDIKPLSTASGTVKIYWDGYKDSYPNPINQRKVAHKPVGAWLNEGTTGAGNISSGIVASNNINSWGFFTLGSIGAALPLHWLSLTGTLNTAKHAEINWQVQENNVLYYQVEKSTDGANFLALNILNSKGDGQNNYQFTELNKLEGIGYYRIKQTDKDGKYSYSPIIKLANNANVTFTVYPNPVKDIVTISGAVIGTKAILTGLDGKLLQQFSINQSSVILNISKYSSGIYFRSNQSSS